MRNFALFLLLILTSTVVISDPITAAFVFRESRTADHKYRVDFVIRNAKENEKYTIRVEFYDNNNVKIPAFTISGDYPIVSGTGNKVLYWDVLKDRGDWPNIEKTRIIIESIEETQASPVLPDRTSQASVTTSPQQVQPPDSKIYRKMTGFGIFGGIGWFSGNNLNLKYYSQEQGILPNYYGAQYYFGTVFTVENFGFSLSRNIRPTNEPFIKGSDTISVKTNSYVASLDIHTDWLSDRKNDFVWSLGAGIGSYRTKYLGKKEAEFAWSIRLGLRHSIFEGNFSYIFSKNQFYELTVGLFLY